MVRTFVSADRTTMDASLDEIMYYIYPTFRETPLGLVHRD